MMVDVNMQTRGENSWLSRPAKGEVLDIAMRYADVNQLVFSNASSSAAIVDCVVVRSEMLVAVLDQLCALWISPDNVMIIVIFFFDSKTES